MSSSPGPILCFEDVSVFYDGAPHPALDRVSFEIGQGERLAVLGLNGSGKTTMLLVPSGLIPHTGLVSIAGSILNRENIGEIRRKIGFLFAIPDDQILFPRVIDDVLFTLQQRGWGSEKAEREALGMLERLGIEELSEHNPHYLSHGERTRVALAGALVGETELLLLDEPSASLDPPGKADLANLLSDLDKSMLVATHDIYFARSACTHFTVLHRGGLTCGIRPIGELSGDPGDIWPPD